MCKSLLATNNTSMSQRLDHVTENIANKTNTPRTPSLNSTIKVTANENTVSSIGVNNLK